jgi:hypothetical protein
VNALRLRQIWLGVAALGVIVVLALGYFLIVGPQLASLASARVESDGIEDQNAMIQTQIDKLSTQSGSLDALTAQLAVLRTQLPTDNGTGVFISQLQTLGDQDAVTVTSYTVGDPAVVAADAASATDAAAAAPATASASQLWALPVTVTVRGSAGHVDDFAADLLGDGTRATLVTSSVIVPASGAAKGSLAGQVIATYSGFVFVDRDGSTATADTSSGE